MRICRHGHAEKVPALSGREKQPPRSGVAPASQTKERSVHELFANHSHHAAKGGRQKGIGKKVTKNEKKVTKKWPKTRKGYQKVTEKIVSGLPPFAYPLLRHDDILPEEKFEMWEFRACFPKENTRIHRKKWAKFMNFSFWPFLWFGLLGRLLIWEVIQEPLPLKPGILVKKSVVLVKRKNGFTKTIPGQKTLEN